MQERHRAHMERITGTLLPREQREMVSTHLEGQDWYIVCMYHFEGKTLMQIGEELGIRWERVRQYKSKALRKLAIRIRHASYSYHELSIPAPAPKEGKGQVQSQGPLWQEGL